jgi:Ca2+-binding RTX toxin-like protein
MKSKTLFHFMLTVVVMVSLLLSLPSRAVMAQGAVDKSSNPPTGAGGPVVAPIHPEAVLISEGFEGTFPPAGWTVTPTNPVTWAPFGYAYSGVYAAAVTVNDPGTDPAARDEKLDSPSFTVAGPATVSFWNTSTLVYCGALPGANCDMNFYLMGAPGGPILLGHGSDLWTSTPWEWVQFSYDLTPYLGVISGIPVYIEFEYIGVYNTLQAWIGIDDVLVETTAPTFGLTGFTADGYSTSTLTWGSGPAGSFNVDIYQSTDLVVDAGDTLLGTVTVTDGTTGTQDFTIGSGAGEMPLPLIDVDEDYYLLAKAGGSTVGFAGVYHISTIILGGESVDIIPGTPVFMHGTEAVDDVKDIGNIKLVWTTGGVTKEYTYPVHDVNEIRIRTHGGDDDIQASNNVYTVAFGGAGNDEMYAESLPVLFFGGEGNDYLWGGPSVDILYGGPGNDTLVGNQNNDQVYGGEGDDFLRGGKGDDILDGGPGSDTVGFNSATTGVRCDLRGQPAAVCTGDGTDTLTEIESLIGGPYNDRLDGDNNDNTMIGYAGDDDLNGHGGYDHLEGGDGNDRLWGGAGDDVLIGGRGNDKLYGESGNDWLQGGFGNDLTNCGGADKDWVDYNLGAGVVVDLRITGPQSTSQGTDTILGCENLLGSPFSDTLTGDDGNNIIYGGDGNDKIFSLGGDDLVAGGPGNDPLDGGSGTNTVTYFQAVGGVTVDLAITVPQDTFGDGVDTLVGFQNLIGSDWDDTLLGDDGPNVIDGRLGDDTMDGRGGVDTLTYASAPSGVAASLKTGTATGGNGNDTFINFENLTGSLFDDLLEGDANDNVIDGGMGFDIVDFENNMLFSMVAPAYKPGVDLASLVKEASTKVERAPMGILGPVNGVTASLAAGTASSSFSGNDQILSFEGIVGSVFDDNLSGSMYDNLLIGLDGNDSLFGLGGDDTILGGPGNDLLDGGSGNDLIDGGPGTDTITFFSIPGPTGASVNLLTNTVLNDGYGDTDSIQKVENIQGSAFNDYLIGDDGDNVINGMAGDDVLVGNAGVDTLSGGSGNDTLSAYLEGVNSSDGAVDVLSGNTGTNFGYWWPGEDVVHNVVPGP